jgi:hypothetical protein
VKISRKIGSIFSQLLTSNKGLGKKKSYRHNRVSFSLRNYYIRFLMLLRWPLCSEVGKFKNTDERSGLERRAGVEKKYADLSALQALTNFHKKLYSFCILLQDKRANTLFRGCRPFL